MSNLSRRSLVTSAAALPALAVPAVAVAASAEPDPIYAAIEKFRHADEAAMARFIYEDNLLHGHAELTPALRDFRTAAMVAVVTAEVDARRELTETMPTTLAGLSKYLDFVLAQTAKLSSDDYEEFFFCDDQEMNELLPFVQSLARSVRHIAGTTAQS